MSKHLISNDAREDLIRIYNYGVGTFGERQASIYYDNFFECLDRIARSPLLFERVALMSNSYRKCVCGSDVIYYKINNDHVLITAIIGSQDFQTSE